MRFTGNVVVNLGGPAITLADVQPSTITAHGNVAVNLQASGANKTG